MEDDNYLTYPTICTVRISHHKMVNFFASNVVSLFLNLYNLKLTSFGKIKESNAIPNLFWMISLHSLPTFRALKFLPLFLSVWF